MKENYR